VNMKIGRMLKHLITPPWRVRKVFPSRSLEAIEKAITESERSHVGELRFIVENALDYSDLWHGITARQRAIDVFSECRIWDTEQNSGVLIYLLLADRDVEIIADRGINAKVEPAAWLAICQDMENRFRTSEFEHGVIDGITAITKLLQQHFPARNSQNPNEIDNASIVLS